MYGTVPPQQRARTPCQGCQQGCNKPMHQLPCKRLLTLLSALSFRSPKSRFFPDALPQVRLAKGCVCQVVYMLNETGTPQGRLLTLLVLTSTSSLHSTLFLESHLAGLTDMR